MLSWIWTYAHPYRGRLCIAMIALIATTVLTLSMGQGVRYMLDYGFAAQSLDGLAQALWIFLVIITALAISAYFRFYMVSWLGERVVADIRKSLYRHLLSLEPGFFEDNLSGEIQSRITTDTTLLQTVIGSSFSFALRNSLTFVCGLFLMFYSNVKLSFIVLAVVPLIVFPLIFFGRKVRQLSKTSQDKVASVGAWAGESLQHIKIVQAFTREDLVNSEFSKAAEEAFQVAVKRIQQRALLIALVMVMVMGSVASMLYVGGKDVLTNQVSAGELGAFVFYAIMVAASLAAVTEVYGEVQRAAGAAERIQELMATKSQIGSPQQTQQQMHPLAQQPAIIIGFNQVSYAYPSRPQVQAIDQLELQIKAGERIALVGPSGAGKSTLFDLLLRFRDPQQGIITLEGQPLDHMNLQKLRSQFALVPQQPVLFSGTVLDNLRYGQPDASEAAIITAAKAAHAHEFISQLPEGYNAYLGEQGVKLSGGQKQRLAIARAILRDPKILLLDEATSALDAQSEHLVQNALNELMKNRTTLVIAHRLATVVHVDRIAVFDHGQLVDIGSHQQLLKSSKLYQRLAQLQFHYQHGLDLNHDKRSENRQDEE